MNKTILASVLTLLGFSLSAQKVIERPSFKGTTANYLKVLRIELTDTATAIDFRIHFQPGNWISIPKETCIRDGNSAVLVNKKGKVVQDKIYFASANSELKKLFEEHLKN